MIRLNLVASLLLIPGAVAAQPVVLGLPYNQTVEDATALLVRAAQPGIQALRHSGIQALRHPGIQASGHPGRGRMICPSDGAVERHDLDRHRLFRHKSFVGLAAANAVGHGAHWYGLARQAKFNALLGKVAQVAMLNRRRLVSMMGAPRADATLNDPEPCAPEYFATNKPLVIHRPMALRQEAGPALPTKGYGLVVHSLDHLAAFDCRCPPAWSYPPLSLAGDAALHTL